MTHPTEITRDHRDHDEYIRWLEARVEALEALVKQYRERARARDT